MAGDRRDSVAVPANRLAVGSGPEVEIDTRARPYSHAELFAAELAPGRSRPEHENESPLPPEDVWTGTRRLNWHDVC
jgi:hypothetical protein